MPESLQAGPRFLTAMVQKRIQGDARAVVALMQIAILFPEHYQLAGSALGQARELLIRLERHEEAAQVARELMQSWSFTRAAERLRDPANAIDP